MRSLRTLWVAAGLLAVAPSLARAQATPKVLLEKFHPSLGGVDYEVPPESAIAACKVEMITNADKKTIGYALRDGQGKLLRKFLDTRGSRSLDQWSYYQDGFEVYREVDLDDNQSLDECRWMNAGGTRIARVKSVQAAPREWKVKVVGWAQISAEEAAKVFVQGLVLGELDLLETVVATPKELEALGVPKAVVDRAAEAASKRIEQVQALQRGLSGWSKQTTWSRLDGTMPHLIPQGADTGLKQDLVLYENAVIFPGLPNGQTPPAEMAFLQASEIVKIGETWKFVGLPRAVDPRKPLVALEGGIRAEIFGNAAAGGGPGAADPEFEGALRALAKYDEKKVDPNDKVAVADFNVSRIPLLVDVVRKAKTADEKVVYNKQIADCLANAYQTGHYPKGLALLEAHNARVGGKVASYGAARKIAAEFTLRNEEGANIVASQKTWMADLKAFLDKYGKCEEAPDALLQLASANEFNAEEEEARKYYEALARDFPESDAGKKAAGALRRLDLVGKLLSIKGPSLKNEPIDIAKYRGKPLLVTFWATWADPVKRDLPELLKVYQKHHAKGFEIVGVCLDNEAKDLEEFLQANPLPWPQIYLPGGLEKNSLATDYGIIALPTMILVDAQGKVVNRQIRSAAELEKQLEKVVADKGPGVALGAQ